MTAAALLDRLEAVKPRGDSQWSARCPAHDDRGPSLSVRECDDGRVLIHCFAGCGVDAVVEAVGLTLSELFPPPTDEPSQGPRRRDRREMALREVATLARIAADEAMVAALGAIDAAKGKPTDVERLMEARGRLEAVADMCRDHY